MNTADRRIAEVERYIHELAIALSGLPADEREDVIANIREHIDDSLLGIAEPTPADVRRILDELGDPLAIAADAGAPNPPAEGAPRAAGSPGPQRTGEQSARTDVPLLERDWLPLAMIGSFAVAGLLAWGYRGLTVPAVALWLLGLVILLASPLWRTVEKIVGGVAFTLVPAVLLAAGRRYGLWRDLVDGFFTPGPVDRLFPPSFGLRSSLDGLLLVAIGLVTLGVVGAWLLHRGSTRAHH